MKLATKSYDYQWWQDCLIIAFLYLICAFLVRQLPQSDFGSPVWPSAGIAVGGLLARGRSRAWGIFVGAMLSSVFVSGSPVVFGVIAGMIPTFGALFSVSLVAAWGGGRDILAHLKQTVAFILAITFGGTLLQALFGTGNMVLAGFVNAASYGSTMISWWIGDAIGVLVFAPLVAAWWQDFTNLKFQFNLFKELGLTVLVLAIISYLALFEAQPVEYLLIPPLLWSAFRFGARVTTLLITVTAMAAAVNTSYGLGIFYRVAQENQSLLLLQLFMGVIAITTTTLLALVAENQQAGKSLQEQIRLKIHAYEQLDQINRSLEDLVNRRTQELSQANLKISSLNQQLTAENQRMSSELAVTRRLQQMILPKPSELQNISQLEIVGFMQPADEVGGDYYDVLVQNSRIKIGIGDVTGHGLESGVIMIMVQTAIRTLLLNGETDPVRFLATINQAIYQNLERMNCDKNLSLILLDYYDQTLHLSGQHEQVIVVRADGEVELIDTDELGFPIGLTPEIQDFIFEVSIELETGDLVVLYTDGITEAENAAKECYGLERLVAQLRQTLTLSVEEIRSRVIADLQAFIGEHRVYDDITFVVMRRR
ncbi:MAG: SpoIIE family protein phosphatase [Pseudanabaenaceae cyanobacterium bins.68]|nr:SpoIIE family protein phosphatase [Pseudanabaenaceae cyanobacterium bins.68]